MRCVFIICLFLNSFGFSQNEDFESSSPGPITGSTQISGWVFTSASYSVWGQTCTRFPDSLAIPMSASIIAHSNTVGYVDSFIGSQYPIFSLFGSGQNNGTSHNPHLENSSSGNSFLLLGNGTSNFYEVSKKFKVNHNNSIFRYAYIYAGNLMNWWTCCHAPLLKIRVNDLTTSTSINSYSRVVIPNSMCGTNPLDVFIHSGTLNYYNPTGGYEVYTKWQLQTLDLTNYVGDSIKIDFVVNGGISFFCYAFLDAESRPGMIYANGLINTTGSITSCNSATLSATPGYSYSWYGPNINNSISQSITVNTSGIYSLTMSQGTTVIGTQTIFANIITPLPISFTTICDTICLGETCTLTIDYSDIGHLQDFIWWNFGTSFPSIAVTPSISTSYYLVGTDTNNCLTTYINTIYVDQCVGIRELSREYQNVILFPNPNSGNFTIQSRSSEQIEIYDQLGRTLQTVELMDENDHITELSGFKPGIYFVRTREKVFKLVVSD